MSNSLGADHDYNNRCSGEMPSIMDDIVRKGKEIDSEVLANLKQGAYEVRNYNLVQAILQMMK